MLARARLNHAGAGRAVRLLSHRAPGTLPTLGAVAHDSGMIYGAPGKHTPRAEPTPEEVRAAVRRAAAREIALTPEQAFEVVALRGTDAPTWLDRLAHARDRGHSIHVQGRARLR